MLKSPTLHFSILLVILSFSALLVFSVIMKVEIVATGLGKAIPVERIPSAQAEISGVVTSINMRSGDVVNAGDVVLELDTTQTMSNRHQAKTELERLGKRHRNLQAVLAFTRAQTVRAEGDIFEVRDTGGYDLDVDHFVTTRRHDIRARIALFNAQADVIQSDTRVLEAQQSILEIERRRVAQEVATTREQVARKVIPKNTLRSAQSELDILVARSSELNERRHSMRLELRELSDQVNSYFAEQTSDLVSRIQSLEADIAVQEQELVKADRMLKASRVVAPASGILDNLSIVATGSVVSAQQSLFDVVPVKGNFMFEAIIENRDVGFVAPGQSVNIHVDSFPAERYGFLTGKVRFISPSATDPDDSQSWRYRLEIEPESSVLSTATETLELRSGMTATVFIQTSERRLISYFLEPVLKVFQTSLRER